MRAFPHTTVDIDIDIQVNAFIPVDIILYDENRAGCLACLTPASLELNGSRRKLKLHSFLSYQIEIMTELSADVATKVSSEGHKKLK